MAPFPLDGCNGLQLILKARLRLTNRLLLVGRRWNRRLLRHGLLLHNGLLLCGWLLDHHRLRSRLLVDGLLLHNGLLLSSRPLYIQNLSLLANWLSHRWLLVEGLLLHRGLHLRHRLCLRHGLLVNQLLCHG